jgi:hypothetical protein
MSEALLVCLAGAFLVGAMAQWSGFFSEDRRVARGLRRRQRRQIVHARDGEVVKIEGEVVFAERTVQAPLAERSCAAYVTVVEERHQRGWYQLVRRQDGVDFLVRDETGVARVQVVAAGAQVVWALLHGREVRPAEVVGQAGPLERLLASVRARSPAVAAPLTGPGRSPLGNDLLRARESMLVAGDRVAVMGLARWEPDPAGPSAGYRQAGQRLVLRAAGSTRIYVSDDAASFAPR